MGEAEANKTGSKKRGKFSTLFFDVRPEELLTVARFSQSGQPVNIINAILVVSCIWKPEKAQLLLGWLAISISIFLLVWARGIRAVQEVEEEVCKEDIFLTTGYSLLAALPWPILAYIALDKSDIQSSFFVLLMCVGMSAGGAMTLYRVPFAAFSYVYTILFATALVITLNVPSELWTLNIFMLSFSLMMGMTILKSWVMARHREDGLKRASFENMQLQSENEEIQRLTLLDQLTGLGNRKAFIEELDKNITQNSGKAFSIFLMDLDRFKHVNDSLGHDAGDELLKVIGKRLKNSVASTDVIARFGGDEFALIIGQCDGYEVAGKVAARILERLNKPVTIKNSVINPKASIGVAYYPEHSCDSEELVSLADLALHHAKEKGRGRYEEFDNEMALSLAYANKIEEAIKYSLENDTFEIFYQPKFDLETNHLVGAEALLRCYDEEGEEISREQLFKVASNRGLISEISTFTFERITKNILEWHQKGIHSLPVSINIHAFDLKAPDLMFMQLKRMFSKGITEKDILLEVTEDCFSGRGSDAASSTLDIVDEMGIRLSLDDFGTGNTALSHLKKLPVSEIKIDREFIRGVVHDERDRAITSAALEISRCLGITCVAEGVETRDQLDLLKLLGAKGASIVAQGHFWARAMNVAEFIPFVISYREKVNRAAKSKSA